MTQWLQIGYRHEQILIHWEDHYDIPMILPIDSLPALNNAMSDDTSAKRKCKDESIRKYAANMINLRNIYFALNDILSFETIQNMH